MFRRAVNLFAALSLLLQLSAGWAQGHYSAHEPTSSSKADTAMEMPCHEKQGALKKTGNTKSDCCKSSCGGNCAQACASVGMPASANELDDFISAHFEALRQQSSEAPAHSQTPQRPPAPKG